MRVEIDGQAVEVEPGATILDAATAAGRYVPTLCFDERMAPFGACRVCMVGMEGAGAPVAACTTPCRDDMQVHTDDATARRVAAATVELVLSELPEPPAAHTELAEVAAFLEIGELRWQGEQRRPAHDRRHPYLALQHELCISVRALRARLRRDPGGLRAHGHGPRLRVRHHRRPRLRVHRFHVRVVRRLRGHLSDRRDHGRLSDRACRGVH